MADLKKNKQRSALRRWLLRGLAVLFVLAAATLADAWEPMGKAASGERLTRMRASPQWAGSGFENPQPLWNDPLGMFTAFTQLSPDAVPKTPVPVVTGDGSLFDTPPTTGLRVTWFGHSSVLLEIGGERILMDPIWGQRASPVDWAGPERWYAPPIALEDLPPIDAVVLSHDHYDHLDHPTLTAMKDWDTRFIAPLGVGAHLAYWGIPPERIEELDWWQSTEVGGLKIHCTPSRHASGRHVFDYFATLWAGWAFESDTHKVFYSGDTGLFPAMVDIGERLGPFDLTLIEVGAYNKAWPDWHIGPEQAVKAHKLLRGKVLLPVHWGLWNLAMHAWTEPIERVLVAAEAQGVAVASPRPGQSFEPTAMPSFERWWPDVQWQTAEQHPIVSRGVGDL